MIWIGGAGCGPIPTARYALGVDEGLGAERRFERKVEPGEVQVGGECSVSARSTKAAIQRSRVGAVQAPVSRIPNAGRFKAPRFRLWTAVIGVGDHTRVDRSSVAATGLWAGLYWRVGPGPAWRVGRLQEALGACVPTMQTLGIGLLEYRLLYTSDAADE